MQEQMMQSAVNNTGENRVIGSGGEKRYMRFICVCCNQCVSPGMFTAEGWEVYKKTELCPDCQK
jgi:hypothetical protein